MSEQRNAEKDALAEDLSWTSGEMTRWSETAHPDHNRWSWRGDGHGDALRDHFREQAQALVDLGWARPIPPAEGGTFLSSLLDEQCKTWHERHGVIPPAKPGGTQ